MLNDHGNHIADHGKSWKNHGILFFNFCGNPDSGGQKGSGGQFGAGTQSVK